MPYVYDFPKANNSCEIVVFDLSEETPLVLLVKRKNEPFKGMWSIPGGFLNLDEELEECAARELLEETGLDIEPSRLRQVYTHGKINKDPRGRIIATVYTVVVNKDEHIICANDDAEDIAWVQVDELPSLAANHLEVIRKVLSDIYYDFS